jgi:hypothetical protein
LPAAAAEATEAERMDASKRLQAAGLTCRLLKVVPDACHRCEHNPDTIAKQENAKLNEKWSTDLGVISKLHDAISMGLIRDLSAMDEDVFEKVRAYWWEIQMIRMKSGIRL